MRKPRVINLWHPMSSALVLPAELTIYTAAELHARLLAWLHADDVEGADLDPVRVDAGAVTEVDAAGVQLLLSLANVLTQRQRGLQLVAPSHCLAAACGALGVSWLVEPAASERIAT